MRVIIGYGNDLRGEDGFGVDVIKQLQNYNLKDTKLITLFQLTPEISLELLDADELIFIDSYFSNISYLLACSLEKQNIINLTHHIGIEFIISILNNLYNIYPSITIYSMSTNNFEKIENSIKYNRCINDISTYIKGI